MEDNINISEELEQLRSEYAVLKNKLDEQEIINDRIMLDSMHSKVDVIDEYKVDKQTRLREMVSNAIRRGIRFDYLLVDSWFTCKELVHFIVRRHIRCHFLGMIKMGNTKYDTKEYGALTAKGCIDKLKRMKKGIRYSRDC